MSFLTIIVAMVVQYFLEDSFGPNALGADMTILSILMGTLFYLVFGSILFAVSAYIYNISARLVGGIKFKEWGNNDGTKKEN